MVKDSFKPHPDDFVVVVMGPTGSGKSNFINNVTGNPERCGASNLRSDTKGVTPYVIPDHGFRLVLVDTPGFDDTYRQDSEILKMIAHWLIQKYPDGTTLKVAGIIYLHRITDNRMSGSAHRNLQIFGRLCGNISLGRTRLVMTMWDLVKDQAVATEREAQLRDVFWQKLIDGGATAHRFHNTPASACDIVRGFLSMGNDGELLLQEELVKQQKRLNETEAGKVIYDRLQKLLAEQKRMLNELAERVRTQKNPALVEILQEGCNDINMQIQKTLEEVEEMKIPLSRRMHLWLFGRKTRARVVELNFPHA